MRNWLIHKLGGFTDAEYSALLERYEAIPEVWSAAVTALTEQGKVTLIDGPAMLYQPRIDGALIVAPRSRAMITGSYSESSYFPVDGERRIH